MEVKKTGKLKTGPKPGEKMVTRQMRFDLIQAMRGHGFDPIDKLLNLYDEAEELFDEARKGYESPDGTVKKNQWLINARWQMKMEVADKLMEYIYPKRKAIELTGRDGEDVFKSFIDVVKSVRAELNSSEAIDVTNAPG